MRESKILILNIFVFTFDDYIYKTISRNLPVKSEIIGLSNPVDRNLRKTNINFFDTLINIEAVYEI